MPKFFAFDFEKDFARDSKLDFSLDSTPQITLILMAAGESSRFTSAFLPKNTSETSANDPKTAQYIPIKKQWLRIANKPLWLFVADYISAAYPFAEVRITANARDAAYMQKLCDYTIIKGGATRQESLENALNGVNSEWVLVSDVARYHIPSRILRELIQCAQKNSANSARDENSADDKASASAPDKTPADCIVPALGVSDTTIYDDKYINREKLLRIQTPQLSRTATLQKALKSRQSTDESSIMHAIGAKVEYIKGDSRLEKLTFIEDLPSLIAFASAQEHGAQNPNLYPSYFASPFGAPHSFDNISTNHTFIGNGLDVHGFEDGKEMKLGGISIPCEYGFKAHSDGDVALHSLIDAILGAMGAGDIGEWFPDSDMKFAGADSSVLFGEVWAFARSVGFALQNADITIIAQKPRLSIYKQTIRANIARLLGAPLSAINVKATTTEHLGFVGREEGVCVISSVSLRLRSLQEVARQAEMLNLSSLS
ncbi:MULTISPECIES: 2-C-methyl-D-erythritol 2,4-cyclodiphosphate synthase [unclassified Helicobacter]|uniref:2-C-methyl-D-erythritol 2,4-cyclodiphosphate synthase n=1 Tax=unclassified Helicobacter TaxID=2593540 RepID=UPI000AA5FA70|nr:MULTISPECIES: 2-C-methyl-D-erythritol 2,4-cyclodiphosphate synthase [unclassified Helicobacter]